MASITLTTAAAHSLQWERANSRTAAGYVMDVEGGTSAGDRFYFTVSRLAEMITLGARLADRHGHTVYFHRWNDSCGGFWEEFTSMHPAR